MGTELTRAKSRGVLGSPDRRKFREACGRVHEVIASVEKSRIEAGRELDLIQQEEWYKDVADTFDEFAKREFGFSARRAYQCIKSYKVWDAMRTIVHTPPPENEAICRELGKLETEQAQADVWQKANEVAEFEKRKVTARLVKRVAEKEHPVPVPEVEYETCSQCGARKKKV